MIRHDLPVRPADVGWLGVAIFFTIMGLLGLYAWARDAAANAGGPGSVLLVLAGLVVLLVSAGWLISGAWRRTCWGAPPGGRRERREAGGP